MRNLGFHILLANGSNRRVGSSGKFGSFLRSCAVLHPRMTVSALEFENIIIVFLCLATRHVMKRELIGA